MSKHIMWTWEMFTTHFLLEKSFVISVDEKSWLLSQSRRHKRFWPDGPAINSERSILTAWAYWKIGKKFVPTLATIPKIILRKDLLVEEKFSKSSSHTLYLSERKPWHVSDTWILIGLELDSNFSVRPTLMPNRQYLETSYSFNIYHQ